jgi:hypothetical protein
VSPQNIPFWESIGFEERLARWIETESPDHELIVTVANWVDRQLDDPYRGVRRETDIAANFWRGKIPNTLRGTTDVSCTYWICEEMRQIVCDSIATLSVPN